MAKANWHSEEHDSAWDNIKAAFKRDWEQTKNDFGSDQSRDLDQDVDDTVKQMFGKSPDSKFEDHEQAFRYGHAANRHYREDHPEWNPELEQTLRNDYEGEWNQDRHYVKYAYLHSYRTDRA